MSLKRSAAAAELGADGEPPAKRPQIGAVDAELLERLRTLGVAIGASVDLDHRPPSPRQLFDAMTCNIQVAGHRLNIGHAVNVTAVAAAIDLLRPQWSHMTYDVRKQYELAFQNAMIDGARAVVDPAVARRYLRRVWPSDSSDRELVLALAVLHGPTYKASEEKILMDGMDLSGLVVQRSLDTGSYARCNFDGTRFEGVHNHLRAPGASFVGASFAKWSCIKCHDFSNCDFTRANVTHLISSNNGTYAGST